MSIMASKITANKVAVMKASWCRSTGSYTTVRCQEFYYETKSDLTHWGPVTNICVDKLTITGSDKGLSPVKRQAII